MTKDSTFSSARQALYWVTMLPATLHWRPARSCGLPQDEMVETYVCLIYSTNKKVCQNVWYSPNLEADKEIPWDPTLFGKILGYKFQANPVPKNLGIQGFRQIPSQKSRDWKFLIPLEPATDPPPAPTFSDTHWSSILDFHFLCHYSYIKGNHWTHLLATCIPYG